MRREFKTASSGGRQGGRRQDVNGVVEDGAYVGPLGGAGGGVLVQGGWGQGGLKGANTGDLVPSAGLDGFDGIFGEVGWFWGSRGPRFGL